LQERIKKEYQAANKQREAGVDESEEEIELPTSSKQSKAMQKLIRNREGNDAYESDEEKNPYASSAVSIDRLYYLLALICSTGRGGGRRTDCRTHCCICYPGATTENRITITISSANAKTCSPASSGHHNSVWRSWLTGCIAYPLTLTWRTFYRSQARYEP